MIETYLDTSEALRVVFLLIDIRHEPSKKDVEMYRLLYEKGFNPLIIATKADKISKGAKDKQIALIRKTLGADKETPILPFSALNRDGKEENPPHPQAGGREQGLPCRFPRLHHTACRG